MMPGENDPVTLKEACAIVFRGTITPSTLRAEAARGRLAIRRIGRQDFVTLRDVREMIDRCPVEKPRQGCIATRRAVNGSSETARSLSARASIESSLRLLKHG
jgi:hypothetical protein